MLLDAVNEHVDVESLVVATVRGTAVAGGGNVGGEQEWKVVWEQ